MTKVYSYEEAYEKSLQYFNNNELAASVFLGKYALRNYQGQLLESSPSEMHRRLAKEFARIEHKKYQNTKIKPFTEDEVYSFLENFNRVILQGSPMFAVGNYEQFVSTSNCFVSSSPADSYGAICRTDEELAQISKRRGGVGTDLSHLRPHNVPTQNSARTSTGIIPFAIRYSNTIREVGQCIAKGEKVYIKNKGIVPIEQVEKNDYVWTKEKWVKVNNVLKNGKKEVYKLTSLSGFEVSTSEDHVFQTFNSEGKLTETKLKDLSITDNIVLCIGEPDSRGNYIELINPGYSNPNDKPDSCIFPKYLDENLAYIIGYAYGDGYIYKNIVTDPCQSLSLSCANDCPDIKTKLINNISSIFKYNPTLSKDGENVTISNAAILNFLKINEILKEKCGKLKMPQKILESNAGVQGAFLSGYFDANGYANGPKKRYAFASVDLEFLKDCQKILSANGIISQIHKENNSEKNWPCLHCLCVVEKSAQSKMINFMQESYKVVYRNYVSQRDCWKTLFNIKYNKYAFYPDNFQYLSGETVEKLQQNRKKVGTFLYQDSIASIEKIEDEQETFDLELEKEHLFWCNGIYLHNSGRRGALMLTIDITHPESVIVWDDEVDGEPYPVKVQTKDFSFETTSRYYNPDKVDFCTMKYDPAKVTGANVSIRINNKFMEAVKNDDYFEQKWPIDSDNPVISKRTKARKMWDKIVRSAWQTAEPGILMWDNIIMESPADCYAPEYKTTSTNPCGEIPLSAYDACRLLLSNLYSFVVNPFTPEAYFDYKEFFKYSKITQRLMDDLVDLEVESVERILNKIDRDPEDDDIKAAEKRLWEKVLATCKSARRTGNGITALGDALAALNIPYGSEKAIETVDKIYKTLKFGSYQQSAEMAEVLGHFEGWSWEKEKDNPFINRISQEKIQLDDNTEIEGKDIIDFIKQHGRRNISNLTTAPVGSVSLLAKIGNYFGTTSGIEPQYSVVPYLRRKKINPADENTKVDYVDQNGDKWQEYKVYPSSLKEWMDITGKTEYKESPWWNHCAEQLNWGIRVKLQAAAQKHIDHSISSTLNLPQDVPVDEVKKIYETAYESGCKGVTIYRDGCRSGVLVKNNEKNKNRIVKTKAPKRPKELPCDIHHMTVNRHRYYVVVGLLEKDPYEIWVGSNHDEDGEIVIPKSQKNGMVVKEKRGSYKLVSNDKKNVLLKSVRQGADENIDVVTRTLSFALRHGGSIEFAVDQLEKTKGDMTSFTKVLARTLKKYIENGSKVSGQTCPSCGSEQLIRQEGCITCASCGWAKC